MDDGEIIGFGIERMHLFDRKTQKFTARCYDFAYDYDMSSSPDVEETAPWVPEDENVRVSEEAPKDSVSSQGSEPDRTDLLFGTQREEDVDMTQSNNIDDLIS